MVAYHTTKTIEEFAADFVFKTLPTIRAHTDRYTPKKYGLLRTPRIKFVRRVEVTFAKVTSSQRFIDASVKKGERLR